MNNFYYCGSFYHDLFELCKYEEWEKDNIMSFGDNIYTVIELADLQSIVQLNANWIIDRINEHRFSENNSDNEVSQLTKLLEANIDFEYINKQI